MGKHVSAIIISKHNLQDTVASLALNIHSTLSIQ